MASAPRSDVESSSASGLGAFVVASIPLARHRPVGVVRRTMPVMGTIAQFAVVHRDPRHAHAAIDAAIDELLWVERTMTRFTDTSDIGRANLLAASDGVIVTPETAFVTREALRWAAALDGRYDPAIGAVCKLWDVKNRHEPPPADRVAELAGRRFHRTVEVGTQHGGPGAALPRRRRAPRSRQHRQGLRRRPRGATRFASTGSRRPSSLPAAIYMHSARRRAASRGRSAFSRRRTSARSSARSSSPTAPSRLRARIASSSDIAATSITTSWIRRRRNRARRRCRASRSIADSVMHADAATTALFGMTESEITGALAARPAGRAARADHLIMRRVA